MAHWIGRRGWKAEERVRMMMDTTSSSYVVM